MENLAGGHEQHAASEASIAEMGGVIRHQTNRTNRRMTLRLSVLRLLLYVGDYFASGRRGAVDGKRGAGYEGRLV
jgi:hypothetical protein